MLSVFDVINEVYHQSGHLGQEKTLVNCKPEFYSATQKLVKIHCESSYICMVKNPMISSRHGAKKPIISSWFCDRFQVDLIDTRKMWCKDVYGITQCCIMTVRDHLTGFIYCVALPNKTNELQCTQAQEVLWFGWVPPNCSYQQ